MSTPACFILFLIAVIACVCGEFIQPPPSLTLRSFAEEETRLPCEFKPQDDAKVIQVTWSAEKSNGDKEQIITRHMSEGLQEFPGFAGRVRFTSSDPIKDSTLLILTTRESDQAIYTCHISTFPSGNFETRISLTVWRIPISTLEPVILEEGQTFLVAATCRAIGLPTPRLSWETDIPGQSQNRSSEDRVVTSQYSLHPLRYMNGHKLDCLVWHPALAKPRRLSNTLVVHFPPDAKISGYDPSWSVNQKRAELKCEGVGNPQPHNFTWTRKGGVLPKDITMDGNRLIFNRPLNKTDEGMYECEARNSMGSMKAEVNVQIQETARFSQLEASFNNLLLIIVGGAAGVLVVAMTIIILFITCHHRRRTRKLKRELSEKKEEINNLSRQTSMRRLNSFSTDIRMQTEESMLMRNGSTLKSSSSSVEDICRRDNLGRPAIYPSNRSERWSERWDETEEDMQEHWKSRESYMKNSNNTLDVFGVQSPPIVSMFSQPSIEKRTEKDIWGQREGFPEGEEGDTSTSYLITKALATHFDCDNGVLRPKTHSNAIILSPEII